MKNFLPLFILLIIFFTSAQIVQAHELQSTGSVEGLLHVDPNDSPIAGQKASLIFEFGTGSLPFDLAECKCNLTILQNGHTLAKEALYSTSLLLQNTATVDYTFPESGLYNLKVSGTSTDKGFKDFVLNFEVKVSGDLKSNPLVNQIALWSAVAIAWLGTLWIVLNFIKKKKLSF